MHKLLKIFGTSVSGVAALAILGAADAADPARSASNSGRSAGRVGAMPTSVARIPSQPTLSITTVGNISVDNSVIKPTTPTVTKCPDGAVVDSEYTVENCMNDVLACVNGGALPGGLNDLFNEDLRNSIMNGMGLCSVQVERCVADVRKNCADVYKTAADVWTDFNSRRIQPEYYNFVLRKTGLTPNQAENTCLLLDRNTYGSSFAAVSNDGTVTTEYAQTVGAYNAQQGNSLSKDNPQGVTVNAADGTVDGSRGHYARWDATTATCLVRVAAYNKDKQISNTWLFGALGNDEPAEVWKSAGDTFACNKDLFGFSLMNKTRSAAVVGVGGGAVVGAATGAIIGHGDREFSCSDEKQLKELSDQLRKLNKVGALNVYLSDPISLSGGDITTSQCQDIVDLYQTYFDAKAAVDACRGGGFYQQMEEERVEYVNGVETNRDSNSSETGSQNGTCTFHSLKKGLAARGGAIRCEVSGGPDCIDVAAMRRELTDLESIWKEVDILDGDDSNRLGTTLTGAGIGAGAGGLATAITAFVERNNISCHVGDGLAKVSMGKSHKIDSLKDFYVKWNLRLPDTAVPAVTITDCASWHDACGKYTDLNQCANARVTYKNTATGATVTVDAACVASGSTCVENAPVAKSNGMCQ